MSARAHDDQSTVTVDAVIIGGGPAGLSAALNLGRARADVLLVDTGRPRNAATLHAHGFLTRDGVTPGELRKLGRAELAAYPNVRVLDRVVVDRVRPEPGADGARYAVDIARRGAATTTVRTRTVLLATGLRETLPEIPDIRSFYGMSVFSCIVCDGWELSDRSLALLGHASDLSARAQLIARWAERLTVFTDGAAIIDEAEEDALLERGIRIERRRVAGLEGERGLISGVRLEEGGVIPVGGGFVRPTWEPALDFLSGIDLDRDRDGCLLVDPRGRTSSVGVYAAGDVVTPGPQQLIVAAGQGAVVASALIDDLTLGVPVRR